MGDVPRGLGNGRFLIAKSARGSEGGREHAKGGIEGGLVSAPLRFTERDASGPEAPGWTFNWRYVPSRRPNRKDGKE
jgi:hypothetical protein